MLKISHITSHEMLSDEWHIARLGKITASECSVLFSDSLTTQGAKSYLYRKVGEQMTGMPCREEIQTTATLHGHLYEREALTKFCEKMGIEFLVSQKLISPDGSLFGVTPDGINVKRISPDGLSYEVETVEAKCPETYDRYISLLFCNTPEDIKKINKSYYYQVCMQMMVCDALAGYLVIYQPHFKAGNMKIIKFRKALMLNEFKFMEQRMKDIEQEYNSIKQRILNS